MCINDTFALGAHQTSTVNCAETEGQCVLLVRDSLSTSLTYDSLL